MYKNRWKCFGSLSPTQSLTLLQHNILLTFTLYETFNRAEDATS